MARTPSSIAMAPLLLCLRTLSPSGLPAVRGASARAVAAPERHGRVVLTAWSATDGRTGDCGRSPPSGTDEGPRRDGARRIRGPVSADPAGLGSRRRLRVRAGRTAGGRRPVPPAVRGRPATPGARARWLLAPGLRPGTRRADGRGTRRSRVADGDAGVPAHPRPSGPGHR